MILNCKLTNKQNSKYFDFWLITNGKVIPLSHLPSNNWQRRNWQILKRKLQAEAIYQRPTRLKTSKENRITGFRLSVVIIKTPHTVKFTCTACQYGAASATGTVATEHPGPRKTILCGRVSIIVSIALIPDPLSHLSNGSKKMTDKY